MNLALNPQFFIILAYFLAAYLDSSQFLAPVQTILPDAKIRAVVLGSLKRMITAANLLGLYSALRHYKAIFFKSRGHYRFRVETTFLDLNRITEPLASCLGRLAS